MAITVTGFPLGWLNVLQAPIDIEAATLKLSLHTASMTPSLTTWDFQSDLTNVLSTANGYTEKTLSGVALSFDSGTGQIRLDFSDVSWTFTADQTWRYAVVWVDTGGAATTDPLLLLFDWGSSQTVNGVYNFTPDAAGVFSIDFTGV